MKLTFSQLEASDLYNAGSSFDIQDPCCRVSVSGNVVGQTKRAVDSGINAEWDEEFTYELEKSKYDMSAKLKVEIFNQNAIGMKTAIGHGSVVLSEIVEWEPVAGQKHHISINLVYVDLMASMDKGMVKIWVTTDPIVQENKASRKSVSNRRNMVPAAGGRRGGGGKGKKGGSDIDRRPALLPLLAAKNDAKDAIKQWRIKFIQDYGHEPGQADKEAAKALFAMYKSAAAIFDSAEGDYKHYPLVDPYKQERRGGDSSDEEDDTAIYDVNVHSDDEASQGNPTNLNKKRGGSSSSSSRRKEQTTASSKPGMLPGFQQRGQRGGLSAAERARRKVAASLVGEQEQHQHQHQPQQQQAGSGRSRQHKGVNSNNTRKQQQQRRGVNGSNNRRQRQQQEDGEEEPEPEPVRLVVQEAPKLPQHYDILVDQLQISDLHYIGNPFDPQQPRVSLWMGDGGPDSMPLGHTTFPQGMNKKGTHGTFQDVFECTVTEDVFDAGLALVVRVENIGGTHVHKPINIGNGMIQVNSVVKRSDFEVKAADHNSNTNNAAGGGDGESKASTIDTDLLGCQCEVNLRYTDMHTGEVVDKGMVSLRLRVLTPAPDGLSDIDESDALELIEEMRASKFAHMQSEEQKREEEEREKAMQNQAVVASLLSQAAALPMPVPMQQQQQQLQAMPTPQQHLQQLMQEQQQVGAGPEIAENTPTTTKQRPRGGYMAPTESFKHHETEKYTDPAPPLYPTNAPILIEETCQYKRLAYLAELQKRKEELDKEEAAEKAKLREERARQHLLNRQKSLQQHILDIPYEMPAKKQLDVSSGGPLAHIRRNKDVPWAPHPRSSRGSSSGGNKAAESGGSVAGGASQYSLCGGNGGSVVADGSSLDGGGSVFSHVLSGASVASYKRIGRLVLAPKPIAQNVLFAPSLNQQFEIPLLQPNPPPQSERRSAAGLAREVKEL
jgi:hypothetical protein